MECALEVPGSAVSVSPVCGAGLARVTELDVSLAFAVQESVSELPVLLLLCLQSLAGA